jgi:predicted permease
MTQVAGLALPFFGLIFLGFVAGKAWRRDERELGWLNVFVIYFALPALFFQLISKTPIGELANGRFVLATTLATFAALAIAFAFAAFRNGGNIAEATVQGLVGGYGNVGYMGPPLALVALGPEAAAPAALVFCFDVTLVFTLTPLMMALAGAGAQTFLRSLLAIPRQVFLHPFILATLAGVAGAALEVRPPEPIETLFQGLSSSAAPVALFALGVTVASRPLRGVQWELPVLLLTKLVLHPLLALVIVSWIAGFDRVWLATAVLMASLPPAATIYVIASQYRIYVLRASTAVLIGTTASVFTVTGVLYVVAHDLLPAGPFAP